jgi:hypothetical protein
VYTLALHCIAFQQSLLICTCSVAMTQCAQSIPPYIFHMSPDMNSPALQCTAFLTVVAALYMQCQHPLKHPGDLATHPQQCVGAPLPQQLPYPSSHFMLPAALGTSVALH